jgi:3-methyladenine DNA glycosylase AlkD
MKKKTNDISAVLQKMASESVAASTARFFKTGKGEYAENSYFIGIPVPQLRKLAKNYLHLSLNEILKLLKSPIHEEKAISLMILRLQFEKGDLEVQQKIFDFYAKNTLRVNNWDLVDASAPFIVGAFLLDKDKSLLFKWVKSDNLWERRIAIVATQMFIRNHRFDETFALAELLLEDHEDLMHKATGWMLREVGKKDKKALERFLKKHHRLMPRTMVRYAIEHFSKEEQARYKPVKNIG